MTVKGGLVCKLCDRCGGSGGNRDPPYLKCPECKGNGWIKLRKEQH